ncbi:cupin domain-containing protein [Microbulbifer guangxiensis]|uniref:cupin domain-containing protein n=1 Tax=Microbulbifer guangxiensis TaxID=2904249 RepID=UPI001F2D1F34|nr:cupin domain-containing protein [Microbulbifer guangxiensis]
MAGRDLPVQPTGQGADDSDDVDTVGARLKAVRKLYGWSQRQLASRAGVTHATISLIEQGRVSPSVGSLKKVLDGIPMSLAGFFTLPLEGNPQVFFRAKEMPNLGTDAVRQLLVGPLSDERSLSLLHETYPPGADSGPQLLTCEGDKGGIVISGLLEVTVGGEVALLGPGDGYFFSSCRPHRLRNPGEVDCVQVSARSEPGDWPAIGKRS